MTSVDSNFNFLCGRPNGAGPPPPVHMRPPEPGPSPPPCGRHKWMAPYGHGGKMPIPLSLPMAVPPTPSNCAFSLYNSCEDSFIRIAEKLDGKFFKFCV